MTFFFIFNFEWWRILYLTFVRFLDAVCSWQIFSLSDFWQRVLLACGASFTLALCASWQCIKCATVCVCVCGLCKAYFMLRLSAICVWPEGQCGVCAIWQQTRHTSRKDAEDIPPWSGSLNAKGNLKQDRTTWKRMWIDYIYIYFKEYYKENKQRFKFLCFTWPRLISRFCLRISPLN